jgi:predicted phage-related endonuclease
MELIKLYGEAAILDGTTAKHIAEFEKMAKEIKAKEDELKKEILKEMESKGIIKLDTDELTISYVAPTDRETLDTKALREELPDIYDTYVKISPVKSSIRIKLKG